MKHFALTTVRAGPVEMMTKGADIQIVADGADSIRAIDNAI